MMISGENICRLIDAEDRNVKMEIEKEQYDNHVRRVASDGVTWRR